MGGSKDESDGENQGKDKTLRGIGQLTDLRQKQRRQDREML